VAEVVRWLRLRWDWKRRGDDDDSYCAPVEVAVSMLANGSWRADLAALDSTTKETTDGK